jgi:hypothetical protein
MEQLLREAIARPHFKIRDGEILTDEDGRPVRDPEPARMAGERLAIIRRERERLTAAPASVRKGASRPRA